MQTNLKIVDYLINERLINREKSLAYFLLFLGQFKVFSMQENENP